MQKKALSESGFLNFRTLAGCALCCAASLLAYFSIAAPVPSGAGSSQAAVSLDWRDKVDARVLTAALGGETEFMVYMAQQADLSGSAALATKEAKGQFVYERLTTTARATQLNVKQVLNQLGAPQRSFWISNTLWSRGSLAVIEAVASLPEVAAIHPVAKGAVKLPANQAAASTASKPASPEAANLTLAVPPGVVLTKAPDAWAKGVRGQGVVVAGADTGVRFTHNALRNQYRGWGGTPEASTHDYNWHDAIHIPNWPPEPANACNPGGLAGAGQPNPVPCDDDVLLGGGHGSHTVGSMVGNDGAAEQIGMAPDAKWMACRNMSNGVGNVLTYLECMEFFLAPTKVDGTSPDPTKAPHVVNNSWGCIEGCPPEGNPLRDTLKASRAAGIVYVVSAGNDGIGEEPPLAGCSTLQNAPARYPEAFTVGATTHDTDTVSSFSSRGPAAADPENPASPLYTKPNISAPGSDIRSSLRGSDDEYGELSGTSMAGPHVAGLVALVISANPELAGNVDRIEEIIEQSALKKTTNEGCGGDTEEDVPNNTYGWGRIDALAAVNMALGDVPAPAQLLNISTRARVQTGDNVLIGGFIVTGTEPKPVLLRAVGPSLRAGETPVAGRMEDPTLELRDSNDTLIASNDDWKTSDERAAIEATDLQPNDDKEPAIVRILAPGAYTAVLRGKNDTTGIALVEIYDVAPAASSILANISSRGFVELGDNVLIGGFIAGNKTGNTRILVRAIGPSMQAQTPNALSDPQLELYDANGAIMATNNNWGESPDRAEIEATGIPPTNPLEAAIIRTVAPAGYTAIVRGEANSTGVALVEIYNVP